MIFRKDENIKYIAEGSALIPALLENGWSCDEIKVESEVRVEEDIDVLKERAAELGLKVHHKTGAEKIKQMIEDAENGDSA